MTLGQAKAASQGGSGWRTRSRPTLLTSRLKLPLVTWKFSSGYNFCRVKKKKKTRTALTASSHNGAWQDARTTWNVHLGRWAPGVCLWEGDWTVLSRQTVQC